MTWGLLNTVGIERVVSVKRGRNPECNFSITERWLMYKAVVLFPLRRSFEIH